MLKVIESLKPNKSPGTNGLTREFYKKFQDLLGEKLVELFFRMLCAGKSSYIMVGGMNRCYL